MKEECKARMLRIHVGENDEWENRPLYEAIVAKCKELGMAGAIVYKGLEGYGSGARIRDSGVLSLDAPIMLSIIDTEEQIERFLPQLDAMVGEGLIAMSCVEIIRYSKDTSAMRPDDYPIG